jgi:hypothetical protein
MKTYLVKYPNHSIYVQANSPEEAFRDVTHEELSDWQQGDAGHLYTVTECRNYVKEAVNSVVGLLCVMTVAVVVIALAAVGVLIK